MLSLPPDDGAPLKGGYYDQEDVPSPGKMLALKVLDPEQLEKIAIDIERGVSIETAACKHVSYLTHHDLMRADAGYREFLRQAAAKARAMAETVVFATKPETWLLKGPGGRGSRVEDTWGDRSEVAASVQVESKLDLSKLSSGELEQLLQIMKRAEPAEAELIRFDTR